MKKEMINEIGLFIGQLDERIENEECYRDYSESQKNDSEFIPTSATIQDFDIKYPKGEPIPKTTGKDDYDNKIIGELNPYIENSTIDLGETHDKSENDEESLKLLTFK